MGISHFCISCQFSMLFNGNFAFLQFSMLFNGIWGLEALAGGGTDGWTDVWTDGRTDRRLEIHPCVLQDIGPLGPLPKKERKKERRKIRIHVRVQLQFGGVAFHTQNSRDVRREEERWKAKGQNGERGRTSDAGSQYRCGRMGRGI